MILTLLLLSALNIVQAADRHILYVPHSGGIADLAARVLAKVEGNTVVINYPATIGSRAVPLSFERKQPLFAGSSYMVLNDILYPDYDHFDIENNFESIILGSVPNVVTVHPSVPARNISEFTAWSKTTTDLKYGITTTATKVSAIEFLKLTGIGARDIPYKAGEQLLAGLLGNEIQLRVGSLTTVIGSIQAQRLKAIAITTQKRHPDFPDIPTVLEQTGTNLTAVLYYGINFPRGMPDSEIRYWKKIIDGLDKNSRYIQEISKLGADIHIIQGKKYHEWRRQQRKIHVEFSK